MKKRSLSMILAFVMIITCLISPAMANPAETQTGETLTAESLIPAEAVSGNGETVTGYAGDDTTEVEIFVCVEDGETVFTQTSDLELAVASMDDQRAGLNAAQSSVESAIGIDIEDAEYFSLVLNGFTFTGEAWMIDAINEQANGMFATVAPRYELIEAEEDESIDLTPNMTKANDLMGSYKAWDLGYTGEGMVIAVIDTGIRQTHEAFSVAPENAKIDQKYLDEVFSRYGDVMHGKNTEGAYYNAKLPYNWDYPYSDVTPEHVASAHGSHVAGIAAGNNGSNFKGVAPDAQIVTMKVFDNNGSCALSDLLAALEDCVYLGVDCVNMSLGIAAGFESYDWLGHGAVYEALEKAGVAVCASAANDGHAYWSTAYAYWAGGSNAQMWLSTNPDNGMIGNPGTYTSSFTVGNCANTGKDSYFQVVVAGRNFTKYTYTAKGSSPTFGDLAAGSYDLVHVGSATADELAAAGDLTGKIALVKHTNKDVIGDQVAAIIETGVAAIYVYVYGISTSSVAAIDSTVPVALTGNSDASLMIKSMVDNVTTLTLNKDFSYSVVTMHRSSSWGPTANLKLKPDITAPGTDILSVEGKSSATDSDYVSMTGTSMSSPAIAGGVLVMKQYLKTIFPDATGTELYEKAYALMMSTAGHANAFVRQQGAGVVDLNAAIKTTAYLTTTENTRPKLELGDSDSGEFTISFKVHNFGTTDKTYGLGLTALTEKTFQKEYQGYIANKKDLEHARRTGLYPWNPSAETLTLINGTQYNVTSQCTLEGNLTVNVKAGETETVTLTLKANESLMTYFEENCPAGMYLEGWVILTDISDRTAPSLSIPFLGFVGDWDEPAVIDEGWWWQTPYGENNLAQFYVSNKTGGIYLGYDAWDQGLGLNPYWDESEEDYVADRNAISPNGDGYLDKLNTFEFSLLRNPKTVRIYIQDDEGNILHKLYDYDYYMRREYHSIGVNTHKLTSSGITFNYGMENLEENETVTFVLETYLDHDGFQLENNRLAKVEIPVTKDTIAPVVTAVSGGVEIKDANYVAYYAIYADANRTELVFEDGVFEAERGVKETYTTDMTEYFVSVADYAHNEAFYYVKDGVAYALDGEGFDHGRTIVARQWWDANGQNGNFGYDVAFGWVSFNNQLTQGLLNLSEISTELNPYTMEETGGVSDIMGVAKTADGESYASGMGYLYKYDPETMEVDYDSGLRYWEEGNADYIYIENFMIAPGTNDIYAVADLRHRSNYGYVCKVDPETAELTRMWEVRIDGYGGIKATNFKDADTLLMLNTTNMKLEERNLLTGAVETTHDMDLYRNYQAEVGTNGYTWSLLYDETENRVYISGFWNYFGYHHDYRGGILMYDLDDGAVKFHSPGSGTGRAVFGMYFLDELVDIPKPEHICYVKEVVAPTCLTEGYTLRICAECGEEFREDIVPALGHDYEAVVTAPTCTELGYTTYTCRNCGDSYKTDYTAVTEHNYEAVVTEPTCDEMGYTTYTCTVCGDSYKGDYTNPTGHTFGQWETVIAPTCTAKGQQKRVCACGETEYREIDMAAHDYETVVTAATCTEIGYTTYTCTVCGDSYTADYVAPTGHSFGEWEVVKAATCTEKGQEKRTCACGETEYRDIDKVEHDFTETVTEPTCTEVGYTQYTCSDCGYSYISDLVQAVGHNYDAVVTAPTCTEVGYTTHTCVECGDSYISELVQPTGHSYEAVVTEPTCTEEGYTTYTCHCGDSYIDDYTAPYCPSEQYTDITLGAWYHEAVDFAVENGLMNGMSETVFAPNANMTRAQLVTVLYRLAGEPSVDGLENPFADVAADEWYTNAIIWAASEGIVKGLNETTFAPGANVTREQIVTILYRFNGETEVDVAVLDNYTDAADISDWAAPAFAWAVENGIITGMTETTLAPQGNATRAQIATILMRFVEMGK